MKHGIAECVYSVLRSPAFSLSCASLQEASLQLGRVQGCAALHEKHADLLVDTPLLFVPNGEKELILERYEHLVGQPYELLSFLAEENVDVESLKKKLSSSGE